MLAAIVVLLVVVAVGLVSVGAALGAGRKFMEKGQSSTALILGLVSAGIIFATVAGAAAYVGVSKLQRDVRRGWNLVPVVVVAQDLPADTTLTFDVISQRSMPEQFVTPSVVTPDAASYVVGQRLTVPLHAGDPLMWVVLQRQDGKPVAPPRR